MSYQFLLHLLRHRRKHCVMIRHENSSGGVSNGNNVPLMALDKMQTSSQMNLPGKDYKKQSWAKIKFFLLSLIREIWPLFRDQMKWQNEDNFASQFSSEILSLFKHDFFHFYYGGHKTQPIKVSRFQIVEYVIKKLKIFIFLWIWSCHYVINDVIWLQLENVQTSLPILSLSLLRCESSFAMKKICQFERLTIDLRSNAVFKTVLKSFLTTI